MTKRVAHVLAGYLDLSESERSEFDQALKEYKEAGYYEKERLKKSIQERRASIDLGPVSSGRCPCCGR
jgi:hypothetical protein